MRRAFATGLVLTLFSLASSLPLAAEVLRVTKTADTFDGRCNADCSLREVRHRGLCLRMSLELGRFCRSIRTTSQRAKSFDSSRAGDGGSWLARLGSSL